MSSGPPPSDVTPRRTAGALAIAAALHLTAVISVERWWSHLAPLPRLSVPSVAASAAIDVELEVASEPASRSLVIRAPREAETTGVSGVTRGPGARPSDAEVPPESLDLAPGEPATVDAGEPGWEAPRPDAPLAGGGAALPPLLGGDPLWMALGDLAPDPAAAPTRAPAAPFDPHAATRVIAGTLQARDRELGLDVPAAGTVATAVATSVRGTPAPHNARATFEVRLGSDGQLLSARFVNASAGDPAAWAAAAVEAGRALAARKLAMGDAGSKSGALVRIRVHTVHQLPSGIHHVQVRSRCLNQQLNDFVAANRKTDGSDANEPAPDVQIFTDENGLPCIPMGIGATLDPSDIGAHRQLMVRTAVEVVIPGVASLPAETPEVDTSTGWEGPGKKSGPRPTEPFVQRKWKKKQQKSR